MNISKYLRKTEKVITDNSPAILTGIGVAGTVTTAYLTGKASFRAAKVIADAEFVAKAHAEYNPFTKKEKFKLVWKEYIAPAGVGAATISCIVGANYVGTRRAAALASAYTLSEKAFTEYREKVVEKMGDNKERDIRDSLAQDRITNNPPPAGVTIITDSPQVLCHDAFSNQYFYSDMETIRKAENDINAQILHADHATVSDFYSRIRGDDHTTNRMHGLQDTSISSDMGWNTNKMLEVSYSSALYEKEGRTIPVLSIDFAVVPFRDPWRFQ